MVRGQPAGQLPVTSSSFTEKLGSWLMLAPGAFTRLGELDIGLHDLDTILLTHLHIDHTADVPSIIKARAMTQDDPVHFVLIGPTGNGLYPSTSRWLIKPVLK